MEIQVTTGNELNWLKCYRRLIYHKNQKRNTMKLSKSCKYDIMILSLPSFVECRKIPIQGPGLIQLRKRRGEANVGESRDYVLRSRLKFSTHVFDGKEWVFTFVISLKVSLL